MEEKMEERQTILDQVVIEPMNFVSDHASRLIKSSDLCKKIGGLFNVVTDDYIGCKIEVVPNAGGFCTKLGFVESPKKAGDSAKYSFIENAIDKQKAATTIEILNGRFRRDRTLDLSDDAKLFLEQFLPVRTVNGQDVFEKKYIDGKTTFIPKWNLVTRERVENDFRSQYVYLEVDVDIKKILEKMYGVNNEEGAPMSYEVIVRRPIGMGRDIIGNQTPSDWMLEIQQFNDELITQFGYEVNGVMAPNTHGFI